MPVQPRHIVSVATASSAASSHVIIVDDDAVYKTVWRLTHMGTIALNVCPRRQSSQRTSPARSGTGDRDNIVRVAIAIPAASSIAITVDYYAVCRIAWRIHTRTGNIALSVCRRSPSSQQMQMKPHDRAAFAIMSRHCVQHACR